MGIPSAQMHAPGWKDRRWTSRVLHRLDEVGSNPISGFAALAVVLAWVAFGATMNFPDWWTNVLYSAASSITLVMVFVIQHTQARQTAATQRKLDELIRASTRADDGLIAVEEASDGHLDDLTTSTIAEREWM